MTAQICAQIFGGFRYSPPAIAPVIVSYDHISSCSRVGVPSISRDQNNVYNITESAVHMTHFS